MLDTSNARAAVLTVFAIIIISGWVWRTWYQPFASAKAAARAADKLAIIAATHKRLRALPPPADYVAKLADALPQGRVVLPRDTPEAFLEAMDVHFAVQNREIEFEPACVVQPQTIDELSLTIKHITKEHILRSTQPTTGIHKGLFAVRCTGANPAEGIAGVKDGILVDLSKLNTIALSTDQTLLTVGGGCTWSSVYDFLDPLKLTVVGGRSFQVGVGGSTLGGGTSFYSGHHGFMCSNVVSYKVVLADGLITTASENQNPDLWRALKGGGNNFGVVAEFVLRVYPGGPVWNNFTITPSFMTGSVLRAYYDHSVAAAKPEHFDPNVSTPILSLAFVPDIGLTFWCTHLFYTVFPDSPHQNKKQRNPKALNDKTWPEYWKRSPLGKLWGYPMIRSKTVTHGQMGRDLGSMSTLHLRNMYVVTGFKLDLATLHCATDAFKRARAQLKVLTPGGTVFCITLQTLNPRWMNKGEPNVLGLDGETDPVVVLELCCDWADAKHDALVKKVMQQAISEIEAASESLGSAHRFRFTNYAAAWQRPLDGYGEKNKRFLKDVSRKYDPNGLFQTGCLGGFKLGREDL
ncbi:FAD binding domain-containing protein [Sarocladium implicatum]|nr:FAD binding domain-containing protein [Sarocladium implicatum]